MQNGISCCDGAQCDVMCCCVQSGQHTLSSSPSGRVCWNRCVLIAVHLLHAQLPYSLRGLSVSRHVFPTTAGCADTRSCAVQAACGAVSRLAQQHQLQACGGARAACSTLPCIKMYPWLLHSMSHTAQIIWTSQVRAAMELIEPCWSLRADCALGAGGALPQHGEPGLAAGVVAARGGRGVGGVWQRLAAPLRQKSGM